MTTIISTSVIMGELPVAWMITEPNLEITIPANTPVAAILPISLSSLQDYELGVRRGRPPYETPEWNLRMRARGEASMAKNSVGEWTHFYRDAVDHEGAPAGTHEAKKIIMKVKDYAKD